MRRLLARAGLVTAAMIVGSVVLIQPAVSAIVSVELAYFGLGIGAAILGAIELIDGFVSVLVAGASLVQVVNPDPALRERRIESERVTTQRG